MGAQATFWPGIPGVGPAAGGGSVCPAGVGGSQKKVVCPGTWSLSWVARCSACLRYRRWFSAQVGNGFRLGWGCPDSLCRGRGSWPRPVSLGQCGVSVPSAPVSGSSSGRIPCAAPSWLRPVLGWALPSSLASWVGVRLWWWPSSAWSRVFWWLPCGWCWISGLR